MILTNLSELIKDNQSLNDSLIMPLINFNDMNMNEEYVMYDSDNYDNESMESTSILTMATIPQQSSASYQSSNTSFMNFNLTFDLITTLTALFYGSAFISGTIGNGLIIYIIAHYPRMRTLSNVFLASLATADLLLVCVCIPIKFIQLITYTWTFGLFMCKAIHYVQSLSAYCSVLTLTIISVERYYAIIHPVKCRATFSMNHIRKMIIITWLLSAILASPSMGVYILVRIGDEYETDHYWCVRIASDWIMDEHDLDQKWHEARIVYELYQIFTILLLPTLVMIFTYTKICTHLWIVFHNRNAMRFGHNCHFIANHNNSSNNQSLTQSSNTTGIINTSTGSTTAATAAPSTNLENSPDNRRNNGQIIDYSCSSFDQSTSTTTSAATTVSVLQSQVSTTSSSNTGARNSTRQNHSKIYCPQCLQYIRTSDEDNQTVKQVIKMLVAVVVLFVVCWAPTLVIGLLRAFNMIAETNEGILKEIITVTFLLSYLNSVINPIIYGFMSKNFRLYFRLIFLQCWSFVTTGHCGDNGNGHGHNHRRYRHHHHRRGHNHYDHNHQKQSANDSNKTSKSMTGSVDLADAAPPQPNLRDKRKSWDFSPIELRQHPNRFGENKQTIICMQELR